MTIIDVQPTTYFTAASALSTSAANLFNEVQALYKCLDMCGSMAGSYDEAKEWAKKYDSEAALAVELGVSLASTMDTYAKTLRTVGWNHQMADYNATLGTNKGPAPVRPTDPAPAVTMCSAPPPSAGGPGNGLTDVVHLAEKVGITIPDGDTDKLKGAGDAWDAVSKAPALGGLADEIGRIINSVSLVHSPEADTVIADLKNIQEAAQTLFELCGGLAADCYDHKIALGYLRSKLEKQLEDLAAEILKEIGIGLAITVVTSMVTFGIGALIEAARVARIVERFAGPIADMVNDWKKARDFKKAVTGAENAEKKAKDIRDLEQRVGHAEEESPKPPTSESRVDPNDPSTLPAGWMQKDTDGITDYISSGRSMNKAVREGTADDPNSPFSFRVERTDEALKKLPDYKGIVTRRVDSKDMPPDVLARYQKDAVVTEEAFTSTSASESGTPFPGDVEFNIVSKTGKDVSAFADPVMQKNEQEVLFPLKTKFRVLDRYIDPESGRTIIDMVE